MEPNAPTTDDYRDMLRRLRVLIVGGGAIGQVFGYHLSQSGAEIAYYLKPLHAAEMAEGFDLHQYGLVGMRPKKHVKGYSVYTDHRRLRALTFDQVWLCVSSTALRSGFLEQLNDSVRNAVWVSFQPGVEDHDYLVQRIPGNRLVTGMVNFIAYQAPLPGEQLWPAGVAFFVPPWSMTQFTGPEPFTSAVANLLQTGGMTAGVRPDTAETTQFGSSVLMPFVVALECVGWSWSELSSNAALLELLVDSIADIQMSIEKATGSSPGSFSLGRRRLAWKLGLFSAPRLASFPIEEYFKFHFTKVRDQSDQMIDDFVQLCRDNAIIPRALEALRTQWRARRPPIRVDPAFRDPATGRAVKEVTPLPSAGVAPARPSGLQPAPVLPAPVVDPETDAPVAPQAAQSPPAAGIDVDFDFGGPEATPLAGSGSTPRVEPLVVGNAGFDEATDSEVDEELIASDAQPIEIQPEMELLPDTPRVAPPILRTLADLDQEEEAPPPKPKHTLPFEAPEADEVETSAPPIHEPTPLPAVGLPSIIIDHDRLTEETPRDAQKTVPDPAAQPGEVMFRGEDVPDEKRDGLKRQDFIQTELASEATNESLRALKAKLRARLGGSLSPALKNDPPSDDS